MQNMCCRVTIEFHDKGKKRLVSHEDALNKKNQGGLNSKQHPKGVYVYEASDSRKYPVQLFISIVPCYLQLRIARSYV